MAAPASKNAQKPAAKPAPAAPAKKPAPVLEQPKNAKPSFKKTACPISRKEFNEHAQPLDIIVGDETLEGDPKAFSSGSIGWYVNGKLKEVVVNGKKVTVQVGANFTIVGSKELPQVTDEEPEDDGEEIEEEEEEKE